jgi:hypothetical protein
VADGIGGALFSEMVYDADGQPLTGSLADYLVATAPGNPARARAHVDSPSSTNPLGVRGVGEGESFRSRLRSLMRWRAPSTLREPGTRTRCFRCL